MLSEVGQFFAGAKDNYNERGISGTRVEITNLDWVGDDLVIAAVRWPYLDAKRSGLGGGVFVLHAFAREDDSFKLRVITLRGAAPLDARE